MLLLLKSIIFTTKLHIHYQRGFDVVGLHGRDNLLRKTIKKKKKVLLLFPLMENSNYKIYAHVKYRLFWLSITAFAVGKPCLDK